MRDETRIGGRKLHGAVGLVIVALLVGGAEPTDAAAILNPPVEDVSSTPKVAQAGTNNVFTAIDSFNNNAISLVYYAGAGSEPQDLSGTLLPLLGLPGLFGPPASESGPVNNVFTAIDSFNNNAINLVYYAGAIAVPEPSTLTLTGTGTLILLGHWWLRRQIAAA
jgi:hypothetical protein